MSYTGADERTYQLRSYRKLNSKTRLMDDEALEKSYDESLQYIAHRKLGAANPIQTLSELDCEYYYKITFY